MDSIIFDIDGTIWNSTDVVAMAWNKALEKENLDVRVTAVWQTSPGYCEGNPSRTD